MDHSMNNLGDVLICPVCLTTYDNRIMQCSQGHSVCECCYSHLTQCPTCRSIFTGARNYALEDVVAKINQSEHKKPVEINWHEALAEQRRRSRMALGPVQAPGHFLCRIGTCAALLPVCRLPNHLRYFHSRQLTEFRSTFLDKDLQFFEQWKFPLRSMHRAVQISRVGLFFIIMEVDRSKDDCLVSAWVEAVCSIQDAKAFRFGCDFVCGKSVASYSDVVYGGNPCIKTIKSIRQCLQVMVPQAVKRVQLQVRIYRNVGVQNSDRNRTTMVRELPGTHKG